MADIFDTWAAQNPGADAALLRSVYNGNQPENTQQINDLYNKYRLPTQGSTTPSATNPQTQYTVQQPAAQPTNTADPYSQVQDYINYYTNLGRQPDMSYEAWVNWRNNGGNTTPTTPATGGQTTPGGQPASTQPAATAGTTVQDYINYYTSRGIVTPPLSYEAWVQMITSGSSPGSQPTEQEPSEQPAQGDQQGQDGQPSTQPGTDPGFDALLYAWAQQTGADYNLLYFTKYGVYPSGSGMPGSSGTPGTPGSSSGLFHEYPAVNPDREQEIRDMYDAQINAERAALQEQGDQAISDAQANRDKIASLYNTQRNAAAVEWERQRRNFLEGAMTSGLNTGAGSQAELSMMGMYQRGQNELGASQAQAEAEADRNIADIKRSTQAAINEAVSKNDYQKAAALLDEYKDQYNRAMDRAEALAKFGDFSGYAALYGDTAALQMRQTWLMSNPEIALALGLITQQQYAALALYKQYPALALGGGTSGGSSGSSGGGSNPATGIADIYSRYGEEIMKGIIDREMSVIAGATKNG